MKKLLLFFLCASLLLIAVSCDQKETPPTDTAAETAPAPAALGEPVTVCISEAYTAIRATCTKGYLRAEDGTLTKNVTLAEGAPIVFVPTEGIDYSLVDFQLETADGTFVPRGRLYIRFTENGGMLITEVNDTNPAWREDTAAETTTFFLSRRPASETKKTEAELRELCPEFFGLDTKDGLTVFVGQMAKGAFSYRLEAGSLDAPREFLALPAMLSAEDMETVLASYGIAAEQVRIVPYHIPYSGYIGHIGTVLMPDGVKLSDEDSYDESHRRLLGLQ